MNDFKFIIKNPKSCSHFEIEKFHELVLKSGQVEKIGLMSRIMNTELLGYCYSNDTLVSISAVKKPNEGYKKSVFEKAGIENLAIKYLFEIGYAFTENEYRGNSLNFQINKQLLSNLGSKPVYATSNNEIMMKNLEKLGFERIGNSFLGKYNEKIQVLVRYKDTSVPHITYSPQ